MAVEADFRAGAGSADDGLAFCLRGLARAVESYVVKRSCSRLQTKSTSPLTMSLLRNRNVLGTRGSFRSTPSATSKLCNACFSTAQRFTIMSVCCVANITTATVPCYLSQRLWLRLHASQQHFRRAIVQIHEFVPHSVVGIAAGHKFHRRSNFAKEHAVQERVGQSLLHGVLFLLAARGNVQEHFVQIRGVDAYAKSPQPLQDAAFVHHRPNGRLWWCDGRRSVRATTVVLQRFLAVVGCSLLLLL